MEKEIKIIPPEGYVIDEENSTFECIKFKHDKDHLTYDDIAEKLFPKDGFYVNPCPKNIKCHHLNNYASYKQNLRLSVISKLMNVAKYLNGDWKPDWNNNTEDKWFLGIKDNKIYTDSIITYNSGLVYFKTKELAQKAIKILGEDVIHLALSTDY